MTEAGSKATVRSKASERIDQTFNGFQQISLTEDGGFVEKEQLQSAGWAAALLPSLKRIKAETELRFGVAQVEVLYTFWI
ncbi:MAG TPA: hypothetical protein VN753_15695 [Terracidiphilus sp.]|nr:hypothetical protein [Terracidiphilus sp.]